MKPYHRKLFKVTLVVLVFQFFAYAELQKEVYGTDTAKQILASAGEPITDENPNEDFPPLEANATETDESMDAEGEWVNSAPSEEIEKAKHGLDKLQIDFEHTGTPLAVVGLVIFVTFLKPTLHWPIVRMFPESVVLMAYGVFGAFISKYVLNIEPPPMSFDLFFMILLPAIVIDAGLSMQKKEFLQSMVKITLLALFGTVLNAVLLAISLYLLEAFFGFQPGFLHMFVFSSLISAVDPVSVLSTFAELDVKKDLFTLIFGESLCNDAVTIVLYRTAISAIKANDASEVPLGIWDVAWSCTSQFFVVAIFGIFIGIGMGFVSVMIMKIMVGHQMNQPVFQYCLPYFAYTIAESFHYSGIISAVLTAALMAVYMADNMCVEMEFASFAFSKTASSLSESCIFFYLGVSLVSHEHVLDVKFIAAVIIFCTIYRLIVTCALSAFYNLFVSKKDQIPFRDQLVVTHAGIRGAVCFGLVQIIDERIIPAKPYFVTATLVMIFWTSILQGCTIKCVMRALKIPGDDGQKKQDTWLFSCMSDLNNKYLKKYLTSDNTYLPTDETFRHLGLPKAVSTALRIGERSQTDLTRHDEVSRNPVPVPQVSVGRPTVSPFTVDFNIEDDNRPLSTGRRTPVARNPSRYSRHFIYTAAPHELENYLTCPVSGPKRPTFDPNQLYNNQNTISNPGDADRARCINRRHNSMGAESIELKHLTKERPLEKKLSRTVTSGNKKFVVNPDDLIREESPAAAPKKTATFEDDEISKIDDSE